MADSERIIEDEVERLLKQVASEPATPITKPITGAGGGASGGGNDLTTGLLKGVAPVIGTLREKPPTPPVEFKPRAVDDTSIERFLENGEQLYLKQLKRVTDMRASIDQERSELINRGLAKMREHKMATEKELFEFDQKADIRLGEAEHMLRALDNLRRTR